MGCTSSKDASTESGGRNGSFFSRSLTIPFTRGKASKGKPRGNNEKASGMAIPTGSTRPEIIPGHSNRSIMVQGRSSRLSISSYQAKDGSFRRSSVGPSSFRVSDSSPLFDPDLMSKFEKAVDELLLDEWGGTNTTTTTTTESDSLSTIFGSTSEKMMMEIPSSSTVSYARTSVESDARGWNTRENVLFEEVRYGIEEALPFRMGIEDERSKCLKKKIEKKGYGDNHHCYCNFCHGLDGFKQVCPPGGGAERVVLYFTSLRGVRRTFENCCAVRLILQGLHVRVDERDVWMHAEFRCELNQLLGLASQVPRLFIKGRYIGGAEEVQRLHEDGILAKILQEASTDGDIIMNWGGRTINPCFGCGDIRFIPCLTCNGSCKVFLFADAMDRATIRRCPDCNENGLIMCPVCSYI